MKKLLGLFAVALVLVQALVSCGGSKPVSSITPTPSPSPVPTVSALILSADSDTLSSNQADVVNFTVRALDASNVVVEGAMVRVSTTGGAVSASSVETGADGRATFTLDSGSLTANQVVTVTVSSGSAVATYAISVVGTTFSMVSDKVSVGLSGASTATLTVTVRDGSGNLISGESFTLTALLGTLVNTASPSTPSSSLVLTTGGNGTAKATYSGGASPGTDTITLTDSSSNPITSVSIAITGSQFAITDARGGVMDITETNVVSLNWTDGTGVGVADAVRFTTTNGTFVESGSTVYLTTTSAAGTASATLSPTITGLALVTVQSLTGSLSDTLSIDVGSGIPATVSLSLADTVLAPVKGSTTPSTIVTATVRDAQNRAVPGVNVSFSLTDGPGAGEIVSPGSVTTDSAGIARTTFFSGNLPSKRDGVRILATIIDENPASPTFGDVIDTDTASVTIATAAVSVTLGYGNKIAIVQVGGTIEESYAYPFTVYVSDINGTPVPNQRVNLSIYPTRFFSGFYTDSQDASTQVIFNVFTNEDTNRNGILEAGEDRNEDTNQNGVLDPGEDANGNGILDGDGALDPGFVASIPATVTTDANGFTGFDVVYAKSFGNWVEVEVTATTDVAGSESRSTRVVTLPVAANDPPYLSSPFNNYLSP